MYRLFQKIQIGNIGATGCVSTEINKSVDNFTQSAVIVLPNYKDKNNASFIANEAQGLESLISRDDIVRIWSGYNKPFSELPLRFSGFVTRMEIKENITIYCEDYGYVLKQINVPSKTFTNATIKTIVDYALQGANINVEYDDENTLVGDWVIDNNSVINALQVLEKLEEIGIRIYFSGTTLRIGGLTEKTGTTKNFIIEHNVIEDNLIYRDADGANVVIKGISNLDTNEKIERFAYLKNKEIVVSETGINGEQRTLNFYNKTATELENLLRDNFNKYIYTGWNGTFTTFLDPFVDIDDNVNIFSLQYHEKNGNYKLQAVSTTVDINGAFQTLELSQLIQPLKKIPL